MREEFGDDYLIINGAIFLSEIKTYLLRSCLCGLTKQIQNLISLRDALLPKLISGELALDDLPADVAEAAEAV